MKILNTTDGKYIGYKIDLPYVGQTIYLEDFSFTVLFIMEIENGKYKITNNNYTIIIG